MNGLPVHNPMENRVAVIPGWLSCRSDVSPGAKLAYARLRQYEYEEGVAAPSVKTLAKEIGAKARTTTRFLKELKDLGVIEVVSGAAGGHSNCYRFPDQSGGEL